MRTKPYHHILSFMALSGVVYGNIGPSGECVAQAWVRAPDLIPNTVVQGDTRVRLSAGCSAVEKVLLGLRLKERSFIKALHSQEARNFWKHTERSPCNSLARPSPWAFPWTRFANRSDEVALHETLANKDLWMVREEERVVFEIMQAIHMAEGVIGSRDVVQDFAILVPSTNFPPALNNVNDNILHWNDDITMETADVESIYEYFVRVHLADGVTKDVSAGITGFQPLSGPTDTLQRPSSETVELKQIGFCPDRSPITNYTAQISTISGLVFTEGSEGRIDVTVVITRTGPARTFTSPLPMVRGCVEPTFSSKWAVEYGLADSEPVHRPGRVLRSTLEDVEKAKRDWHRFRCSGSNDARAYIAMPNSTIDEIQSHEIVTTSATVILPIEVDRRQITNFETYYQTLANSLVIKLEIPPTDEGIDPDIPSSELPSAFASPFGAGEDIEEWVPSEKQVHKAWRAYTGRVPVVVRPIGKLVPPQRCYCASTDLSCQVVMPNEGSCEQLPLAHYLDVNARGPTFVDHSAAHELLAEDPAARELRAPILAPVASSLPRGEELVYRYDRRFSPDKPLIYVGEMWAKKMAKKGQ